MLGERAALAGGGGRACEPQTEPPLLARRDQHEGINTAGERLGRRAESRMNAAAVVSTQEYAGAVGPVVEEPLAAADPAARLDEERRLLELRFALPALSFDPLALVGRHRNVV